MMRFGDGYAQQIIPGAAPDDKTVSRVQAMIGPDIFLVVTLTLVVVGCIHWIIRRRFWSASESANSYKGARFSLTTPEAARPHWKGKRVTVMDIIDQEDPSMIRCLCPATGQLLGSVKADSPEDIDRKVREAHASWLDPNWKQSTPEKRKRVLKTMLRFISEHQREVAHVACRDTGKTMLDAGLGEIMVTLEKLKWIIKNGSDALQKSSRPGSSNPLLFYKGAEVVYEPLGVVCAMVSWNYPLHNLLGPVAASLFVGDAVVVKCSEQVVWSSEYFVRIAQRALELEGFDPRLVQLVKCWPQAADSLTAHPLIKHITFIGSRPVAHLVARAASVRLTPLVVELGGKDPLIVLEDIKHKRLKEVASIIMRGTFQSAGQNCIGVERVIAVGSKNYDLLVGWLEPLVSQLRLGSSIDEPGNIDMGALIAAHHLDRLEALVANAVHHGAKLLAGGKRHLHPKYPLGVYFEPTLLVDVTKDMEIAQEEVFGPILVMMKAESAEDAVELANSTQFGLGASVFGSSSKVVNEVVKGLRCGNVAINDFATYHMCQLPFGGVDGSGYGKFGGAEGLRGLCIEKSICYDRFPFIHTAIPRTLDYPIQSVSKAWGMMRAVNDVGYGTTIWTQLRGTRRLVRPQ